MRQHAVSQKTEHELLFRLERRYLQHGVPAAGARHHAAAGRTGGSGLKSYRLQVRKPHGRWHTVLRTTKRKKLRYRATRAGRYTFRVRAVDKAGNRSRWSVRHARF